MRSTASAPAGRDLVRVGGGEDQRPEAPHLLVQQTDRVAFGVVGAERVRAHQFGKPGADMRLGAPHRPHLVQDGRNAGARQLPRRLAAGEPAADDVDGVHERLRVVGRNFFKIAQ